MTDRSQLAAHELIGLIKVIEQASAVGILSESRRTSAVETLLRQANLLPEPTAMRSPNSMVVAMTRAIFCDADLSLFGARCAALKGVISGWGRMMLADMDEDPFGIDFCVRNEHGLLAISFRNAVKASLLGLDEQILVRLPSAES